MVAIRAAEASGREPPDLFSDRFLIARPLLEAMRPDPAGPPSC